MTQQEIRDERTILDSRISRIQAIYKRDLAIIRADVEMLQSECKHPDKFNRSIMGRETVTACPDCGWEQ